MGRYEEIVKARALFGIGEEETIKAIRQKINTLIRKNHPDTGGDEKARTDHSIELIHARKVIMDYLDDFRISFAKHEVDKYRLPGELWMDRFGDDHIWGKGD